jgi:hypothetical protein
MPKYVGMMSAQYSVIQTLHDTSFLQMTKAQFVQEGRLMLDVLIRTSPKAAENSLRSTRTPHVKFQTPSAGYKTALEQIEANLNTMQQKLDDSDKNIKNLEQQEHDKLIWAITDTIAPTCVTGIIFASAGALGPVAAALTTAAKIGLGAAATAAAVKLTVDSLGLDDVEKLLRTLHSVKQDTGAALKSLKTVQPIFANVVKAADGVEAAVVAMVEGLEAVRNDAAKGQILTISEEDISRIRDSWQSVYEACLLWMDVVNGQGIVPAI